MATSSAAAHLYDSSRTDSIHHQHRHRTISTLRPFTLVWHILFSVPMIPYVFCPFIYEFTILTILSNCMVLEHYFYRHCLFGQSTRHHNVSWAVFLIQLRPARWGIRGCDLSTFLRNDDSLFSEHYLFSLVSLLVGLDLLHPCNIPGLFCTLRLWWYRFPCRHCRIMGHGKVLYP